MGNFNRDDRRSSGGRPSFGGGSRFGGGKRFSGGRDVIRPDMHKATCGECGAACEVPFRPTGDRPVYCRDCFAKQGGNVGRERSFGGDRRERPRFDDKQKFDAVCSKCNSACQVPFRPTGERPVFCSNCFDKSGSARGNTSGGGSTNSSEVMEQLKMLNAKIDKIAAMITPKELAAVVVEKTVKAKPTKKASTKKKKE